MYLHQSFLFLVLLAIGANLALAARLCRKLIPVARNCSFAHARAEGDTTYVFSKGQNVSCALTNKNAALHVLEVYLFNGNNDLTALAFLSPPGFKGTIWIHAHCTGEKDGDGSNLVYFKTLLDSYRVGKAKCYEYSYNIAEYYKKVQNVAHYKIYEWTPELAEES